jgi:glycerate-2-kinase
LESSPDLPFQPDRNKSNNMSANELPGAGKTARDLLRHLFDAAVASVDPLTVVPPHLPTPPKGRTIVLGAGKASARMALAVERHWPGELTGLVVTRLRPWRTVRTN